MAARTPTPPAGAHGGAAGGGNHGAHGGHGGGGGMPPSASPLPSASPSPSPRDRSSDRTSDRSDRDRERDRLGLSAYVELSVIGSGTFGRVAKVRRVADGEVLVWKELYYGAMSEKEKQQLVSEVNILRELQHRHVVRYFDRIIDREKKKIYIVMEFCEGGDLHALVRAAAKDVASQHTAAQAQHAQLYTGHPSPPPPPPPSHAGRIPEAFIWQCLHEVGGALHECHRRSAGPILHRDIKLANVFLDAQRNFRLGDFGLARILESDQDYAQTHVGTPYYMSPEQVREMRYNDKSDIWSLGCLLYELAALAPPFQASNHLALAVKIQAGHFARIPTCYSDELDHCIRLCLQLDQHKRPKIEHVLQYARAVTDRQKQAAQQQQQQQQQQLQQRAGANGVGGSEAAAALAAREHAVASREQSVSGREQAADARELEYDRREQQLRERQRELERREAALARKEKECDLLQLQAQLAAAAAAGTPATPGGSGTGTSGSSTPGNMPPPLHRVTSTPIASGAVPSSYATPLATRYSSLTSQQPQQQRDSSTPRDRNGSTAKPAADHRAEKAGELNGGAAAGTAAGERFHPSTHAYLLQHQRRLSSLQSMAGLPQMGQPSYAPRASPTPPSSAKENTYY